MKNMLLTGALALLVSSQVIAAKADEGAAGPQWSGIYTGFHLGGAEVMPNSSAANLIQPDASGPIGGVHVGFNFPINENFLIGLEGDFTGYAFDDTVPCFNAAFNCTTDPNWNSSVRARVGGTFGGFHIYGTGGLALLSYSGSTFTAGVLFRDREIVAGWTAGGGVEFQPFGDGLVLGVEALYSEFESATLQYDIPYTVKPESIAVRARVSVQLDAILPGQ